MPYRHQTQVLGFQIWIYQHLDLNSLLFHLFSPESYFFKFDIDNKLTLELARQGSNQIWSKPDRSTTKDVLAVATTTF